MKHLHGVWRPLTRTLELWQEPGFLFKSRRQRVVFSFENVQIHELQVSRFSYIKPLKAVLVIPVLWLRSQNAFFFFCYVGKVSAKLKSSFLNWTQQIPLSPSCPVGTLFLFTVTRACRFCSFSSKIWFSLNVVLQEAPSSGSLGWVHLSEVQCRGRAVHRNPYVLALAIRSCYSMLAKGKRCCLCGEQSCFFLWCLCTNEFTLIIFAVQYVSKIDYLCLMYRISCVYYASPHYFVCITVFCLLSFHTNRYMLFQGFHTHWSSVHPESTLFEIKKWVFMWLLVSLNFCHVRCDFYVCVYTHTKKN